MANHAVFASSDLRATRAGHILNLVHTADCDNGTIWAQGDLVGQGVDRETYKCKAGYRWRQSVRNRFRSAAAKSKDQSGVR